MHLAVDFGKYTDERATLVALFIERDLASIRDSGSAHSTFLDTADHDGLSVYHEHERTRAVVSKQYDRWLQSRSKTDKNKREGVSSAMDPPEKPMVRVPRAAMGPKDPGTRRDGAARTIGDRAADRIDRGADRELDERELLRQRKKAEETARLQEGLSSTMTGPREERDAAGRDSSRPRPARGSDLPGNLTRSTPPRETPSRRQTLPSNEATRRASTPSLDRRDPDKDHRPSRRHHGRKAACPSGPETRIISWSPSSCTICGRETKRWRCLFCTAPITKVSDGLASQTRGTLVRSDGSLCPL